MSVTACLIVLAASAVIGIVVDWFVHSGIPRAEETPDREGGLLSPSVLSEQDHQIAQQTGQIVRQCFGAQLSESIPQMSASQRVEATKQMVEQLSSLYHISITSVRLVELPQKQCGNYNAQTGVITLNSIYLMTNNIACVREFLDTIVHELRHAVQLSILEGNDFWQTSNETMESWLHNLVPSSNYCKPKRNFRRYAWQPVERDAAAFAYYSLREVQ